MSPVACGLYYKRIRIVNDDSRVNRMILQVVASPTIVIPMIPEELFMLLDNIHNAGLTQDHHLQSSKYFYSTAHWTIKLLWY